MTYDRRTFLGLTGSALLSHRGLHLPRRADLVLRNATVYDGSGQAPFEADVAIAGDRISALAGSLSAGGTPSIDLDGLAVAPGFIDIHSHTDSELFVNPSADSKIRQGVTTEVAGQDGSSMGPWPEERAASATESYRERYGTTTPLGTLGDFMRALAAREFAVNFATMVGHGTIRETVIGNDDRPATPGELEQMRLLVRAALSEGACGLSSGLEYVPGAFGDLSELVMLARELQPHGLPYASHMRNEDDQLIAAVEEALNVGQHADVPVQISHLKAQGTRNWWKRETVLAMLMAARGNGIDVTYDRYPYIAYSTGLTSLFPVWSRDGGNAALLGRLDDPTNALQIERAVRDKIAKLGSWDAVQVTSTANDSLAWAEGQRLGSLAKARGIDPYTLLRLLITGDLGRSGMVGFGMSEENTAAFLAHPLGMVCSDGSALATDGPLSRGTPHPRSFGTFPRVLGHYSRDERVMPLETAIHKMTAMPARRLRLVDRGVITPGTFADIVVFNPATVADRATFANPHQYPVGIEHVIVNGEVVLQSGELTGRLPGRVLRPN